MDRKLPVFRTFARWEGPAFVGEGRRVPYAELAEWLDVYYRQLTEGHYRGRRTVVVMERSAGHVALLGALLSAGHAVLLYPPREPLLPEIEGGFRPHLTAYLTRDGRMQLFHTTTEPFDDSPARLVMLTGGTGGRPRAAVFDPVPFLQQYERPHAPLTTLPLMPWFHFGGFDLLMRTLGRGGTVKLTEWDPEAIDDALRSDPIPDVVSATPTFWHWLLQNGLWPPYPKVRRVNVGGEAPWPELIQRLRTAFPDADVVDTWAATETGRMRPESVRIKDGEVWARPQPGFLGYWGQPLELDEDGFFRTGDRGRFDARGRLVYEGRADDMVKIQGHAVSKRRVEEAMLAHPGVAWARAEVRSHPMMGRYLVGRVAPASGGSLSRSELFRFLRERLFSYEVPTQIEVVAEADFRPNLKR